MTPIEVARAFVEAINSGDPDRLAGLMTEHHTFVDADGGEHSGREEMRRGWADYYSMVPDFHIRVQKALYGDGVVALFGLAEGTFADKGELKPENHWRVPAAWRVVVEGDKVAVWHLHVDPTPMVEIFNRIRSNQTQRDGRSTAGPEIHASWKTAVRAQFGAAVDSLESAVLACPADLWGDRSRQPEFWYVVFHALFWFDFYLSGSPEGFAPPSPFGLEELDPAGVIPDRAYSKEELLSYLEHGRRKCRVRLENLKEENVHRLFEFGTLKLSVAELLLYNMRHVQHHAAQLNLILRRETKSAPRWIRRAGNEPDA